MKLLSVFKTFRIHQKIISVFVLLMLLVYVAGITVSFDVQRQIRQEYVNTITMRMNYLAREIDKDVFHLQTQQLQLKVDVNTQKLLLIPNLDDMGMVTDLVNEVNRNVISIHNSSIYSSEVAVCLTQLGRTLSSSSFYRKENDGDRLVLDALPESGVLWLKGNGIYLIETLSVRYKHSQPRASLCYVRLSTAVLGQALTEAVSSSDISVYLVKDGDVVMNQGDEIQGFSGAWAQLEGKSSVSAMTASGRYLLVRQPIQTLGMDLVACIPERTFGRIMVKNQIWLVLMTLAAIVSFAAFTLIANRMINRPINRFVQAFREVEHDNLDVKIEHHSSDEFAYLYNTFNNMTDRLKTSIQQVYQQQIAAQQAELKQLQSQINPHFLYNSFFHVYRLCKMDDVEGAAGLSLKLSHFYQYITRSGSDIVPLEKEYRHAQDYCDIQSIRYGPRIEVTFAPLPEEYRSFAVPRLMLQPVLENAYQHGTEDREEHTEITVSLLDEDGYLKIVVEDNGAGMDEENLRALSARLLDPAAAPETTGLINVSRRLHIKYGGRSGVTVTASARGGLRVELWIIKEEEG